MAPHAHYLMHQTRKSGCPWCQKKYYYLFPWTAQFSLAESSYGAAAPPQVAASLAESGHDDADGPTLNMKVGVASAPILDNQEILKKPAVELRNYFPETWLFSLENIASASYAR